MQKQTIIFLNGMSVVDMYTGCSHFDFTCHSLYSFKLYIIGLLLHSHQFSRFSFQLFYLFFFSKQTIHPRQRDAALY
jgi:hypothetical protein